MKIKRSTGDKIFDFFNYTILSLFCLSILFPFVQQIVISISPPEEASTIGLHLFTMNPTLDSYYRIIAKGSIVSAYYWTILRTVIGTILTVVITSMLAYPLAKKKLLFQKFWMGIIIFTMFFGGGLVPTYLLIKDLHLTNTIWAWATCSILDCGPEMTASVGLSSGLPAS